MDDISTIVKSSTSLTKGFIQQSPKTGYFKMLLIETLKSNTNAIKLIEDKLKEQSEIEVEQIWDEPFCFTEELIKVLNR